MSRSDNEHSGYEIFPWNSHFETGIELIDQQHRKLVAILNRLASHFSCADDIQFRHLLQDLLDYTHYHFEAEERIWQRYFRDQPLYQNHHQAHELFFEQVKEYWQESDDRERDLKGLFDFLTRWLAFHILESDRRMALMVHAMDSGMDVEDARAQADEQLSGPVAVMVRAMLETYGKLSANAVELIREKEARQRAEAKLRAMQHGPTDENGAP
ncbi:bacteriohemerythrin [Marinobacter zhejiangensis]|uniref:Hemerythrin-like metal-binding domain protein n=1 Tax=Marinobacter zhejiangensis TaxID=488535 RepID=A0A1I4T4T2_9GAMM|nr:bacteriohemerythrin [Marinobacter zhejiangensis]SFM71623.1 hemerythrin-like metal-binding domain protein [Marinobacter zhejiangensis]